MRRTAFAALTILTLIAPPASAASRTSFAGLDCGLAARRTAPSQNGWVYSGFVAGGPVVVLFNNKPTEVTLVCTVQINNPFPGDPEGLRFESGQPLRSSRGSGGLIPGLAIVPPTSVSFTAKPGEPVYVCTEIIIAGMEPIRKDNDNDPSTPEQCDQTGNVDTNPDEWHVDPLTLWAQWCVEQAPFPPVCTTN